MTNTKPPKFQFQKGFTLLELLIAVFITSFLGFAIYTVFSQGLRLWSRASKERPEVGVNLFLEKLSSDLRNSLLYSANPLIGTSDSIQFYTLGESQLRSKIPENQHRLQPKRVMYLFDRNKTFINRIQLNYDDLLNSVNNLTQTTPVASSIIGCKYSYLKRERTKSIDWIGQWNDPCIPEAIKVNVDYQDKTRTRSLSKIISIPIGGCVPSS